jgi:site-specific DNA-cytosine methylase
MRVLLACEESQAVCKEFRKLGHEAFSCDILPCSGGHPEWHIQGDITPVLKQDWDMIIAFPPCTHLAVSGAKHFAQKIKDGRQQEGIDFFMMFANSKCPKVVIENPVGIMSTKYRKPDQIINPFQFGDAVPKKTCLWLKGLPLLKETNLVEVKEDDYLIFPSGKRMHKWYADKAFGGEARQKVRNKTFPGIAKAMAEQWGGVPCKNKGDEKYRVQNDALAVDKVNAKDGMEEKE